MERPNWKCLLIGAVVLVALTCVTLPADAFHRGGCGWGGCGYGGYYSSCYTPRYSSCYSPCYRGCGGWYVGYSPRVWWGCGACGGGCYSSCYSGGWADSVSTCTSCGSNVITSAPTSAPAQAPTPAQKPAIEPTVPAEPATPAAPGAAEPAMPLQPMPVPPPKTSANSPETSGVLTVWVPYDAKVTINGLETRSTGSRRQFISYGLTPGFSYKYEIRAQLVRKGQVQDAEPQTVMLTAGQITAVAFGFNTPSQQVASNP